MQAGRPEPPSRYSKENNTLVFDTPPHQWRRYQKEGVFGVGEAKRWLGFYVNDGTTAGAIAMRAARLTWPIAAACVYLASLRRPRLPP